MGNKTIISLLHEKCKMHGKKRFLLFEDEKQKVVNYTYNEFLEQVNRLSNVLLDLGVKKGDRVTLHLPNSSDFVISWFALANIGAIMVPTNVLSTKTEMEYLIEHSESVLLITEKFYLDKFESIRKKLPKDILLTRCSDNFYESISVTHLTQKADKQNPKIKLKGEDVVAILYTSGTTSKPKGCLITHTNYIYTGEAVSKTIRFSPKDRALIALPLFHGNGQYYLFMPALTVGASVAITEKFSASQYIKQTKRLEATIGSLFAAPIRMILANKYEKKDKKNFLRLLIFAQSVTLGELTEFEKKYKVPLLQLYGMTETVAPPLMNSLDEETDNLGIGKPIISSEVKLINELGKEVGINHPGQIVVKGTPGRTIMKGYFKDEKETNNMMKEGWLHTGDTAKMTENGYFIFLDRQKDMIKRAGENISTQEVEEVIMSHPYVYEAAVVGVADSIRDEAIKAFVILKEAKEIQEKEMIEYCSEHMMKFKIPDTITFVKEFPRTSVGKIQKHKLINNGLN